MPVAAKKSGVKAHLKELPPKLSTLDHALIEQRKEINTQLDLIVMFMDGPVFTDMDPVQRELLTKQMQLLTQLSHVLLMRIDEYETARRRAQLFFNGG